MTAARADGFVHLADYAPPAWRIRHAELKFDLDLEATEVEARLHLVPSPESVARAPLRLDGEALELLSVKVDGVALGENAYRVDAHALTIPDLTRACVVETRVRIRPAANTQLSGLYASRGLLLTQCEAEGFRRITWFLDRPDVMPTWRIVLRADKAKFPVLLANGNPAGASTLAKARHVATWKNPHPTPAYLFALVAGDLDRVQSALVTAEGRGVELSVWAAPADVPRCRYALAAVERAMRWDEQRFGRSFDLDVFNVVAVQDFTMGAMENKGLNIFNARYILADAETATDADTLAVESVIGHEYFHNWSGNRVTLRDWFQLALKEGLTVFRDQEFTADLHSRSVKRIEDVRLLRGRQFVEDTGVLAHPVRPDRYREINNFYTLTVYEKGAELVRMLHTLLGERAFRAGMDRYFAEHDGSAATIEDFLAAHAAASDRDLTQFARWYAQAGTPEVAITDAFDAVTGSYLLTFTQHTPRGHGQPRKRPLHIPLRFALYTRDGREIGLTPRTEGPGRGDPGSGPTPIRDPGQAMIELTAPEHWIVVRGLREKPLPAFNQGFGAPVKIRYHYEPDELGLLAHRERDPFNRWNALQRLATGVLLRRFEENARAEAALSDAIGDLLEDSTQDPAFVAECLELPDFDTLADSAEAIDVDALIAAREDMLDRLAEAHADRLDARRRALAAAAGGGNDGRAMGARRLRNACLGWLTRLDPLAQLAQAQLDAAANMTDRLAALRCLVRFDAPAKDAALARFRDRYAADPLVTDKWIALVATRPQPETLDDVRALLASKLWTPTNPNRVRAVLGSFARMNPVAFHHPAGRGYRLLAEQLPALDAINAQVAARLLGAFESWRRLAGPRRGLARAALASLSGRLVSRDARDLLARLVV